MYKRQAEYTGSRRAAWILENWAEMQSRFIKVFPHEYKRVLGVPRLATPLAAMRPMAALAAALPLGD